MIFICFCTYGIQYIAWELKLIGGWRVVALHLYAYVGRLSLSTLPPTSTQLRFIPTWLLTKGALFSVGFEVASFLDSDVSTRTSSCYSSALLLTFLLFLGASFSLFALTSFLFGQSMCLRNWGLPFFDSSSVQCQ